MSKPSSSLGDALERAGGRPAGFDYLRIGLSLAVFFVHVVGTTYGQAAADAFWSSGFKPFVTAILPMFFALSGFLVAGSMERCASVVKFLGLRAIRIYPALVVEVLLSALIIGPLVTTVSFQTYFTDPVFWRYLVNVTGHISFYLPGVFAENPVPHYVNRQLWTVPYELQCYIALGTMMVIGAKHHRIILPVGALLLLVAHGAPMLLNRGILFDGDNAISGQLLVISFLFGVTLFLYRDRIPFARWFFLAMTALSIFSLSGLVQGTTFLAPLPVAYVTAYLGLLNPPRVSVLRHADYSYGIFLYGAIVQQTVMNFSMFREWYWNIGVALPLTIFIAVLSWHLVEKPAQGLKGLVGRAETRWLSLWARVRLSTSRAATDRA